LTCAVHLVHFVPGEQTIYTAYVFN